MGLLDEEFYDDPQRMALMRFGTGLLSGGGANSRALAQGLGGMVEGGLADRRAKQRALEEAQQRQIREMQMQEMRGQMQARDAALQRQAGVAGVYKDLAGAAPKQDFQRKLDHLGGDASPTLANAAKLDQMPPQAQQGIYEQLMAQAQALASQGYVAEANAKFDDALKARPKYSLAPQNSRGADGKLSMYQLADDGSAPRNTGLGVAPKMTEMKLGDRTEWIDENEVKPGQTFAFGQSPDSKATSYNARMSREQQERHFQNRQPGPEDASKIENVARMISEGRMPALGAMAMRTPYGQSVMSRVAELNPEYRSQTYGTGAKAEKDFATGKNGNTVRSFNVSLEHLTTLDNLTDALDNGNVQLINKVSNIYKTQTGQAAPVNFEAAKKVVADEVVKAIVGSGGGVTDREEAAKTIMAASSPKQLKGVISTYKELMVGQLHGLGDQYRASTGRDDFDKYLSQEAKNIIQKKAAPPKPQPTRGAPMKGQVIDGYRFKGGDPSDQSNWERK